MSRKVRRLALAILVVLSAAGLGVWIAVSTSIQPASLLYLLYVGLSLTLGAIAATTLVWMLYAWRTPDSFAQSRLRGHDREPAHSFSLIVPARHEEAVLETTLARLVGSDHPAFEVIIVVGDDDPATREAAERVAGQYPMLIQVVVDSSCPKSKPKALNAALPHCAGTVTGVFDAEDDVHPALLRRVDQCFQGTGADIVQGGVQLMNFRSSWLTVHNVLEYYFWFRSRLHRHARQRFIPLGGNTVFIRTQILRAVAGWDPDSLAEDCELGVRLSALGAHTVVFYEPELVTREECPPTLGAFVRQRTRWNQGYLQTLSRGYWRRLPLPQRALGAYILAVPFAMAIAWLLIPVAIATAVFLKAPIPITLISFLPLLPMMCMLVADIVGLGEFCRAYGERPSLHAYGRLVLGLPLYQAVLSFAAARAVVREARGVRGWEKTAHLGLHLGQPARVERVRSASPRALSRRAAALRAAALGARSWRVRNPELALAEAADLAPGPVTFALAQTSASPHHVFEPGTDPPDGSPITGRTEDPPRFEYRQAWPGSRAGVAGNGHSGWQPLPGDYPVRGAGGRPLWMQFDDVPAADPTPPSLPSTPPIGSTRVGGSRRGGIRVTLGRLVGSHADVAVQVPLLIGLGLVQAMNLFHWPGPLFDEGTYVGNAWAAGHRGALAFYTYTYGHPPLGWLLITLWTSVSGLFGRTTYSLDGARELMCAINIVSFSLLYTLARRLKMSPLFAAGAVVLFALCPLALFFHRGALLDNPATVWAIAAFVLAMSPQRRLWSFAGSGACFAASVLSKETTLVLLPPLLLAALQNTDTRTRRYCLALLVSFFLLIGLAFPLYATLKGELLPGPGHVSLVGTDIEMLFTRQATGSIFNPHSVAHGTVTFWLGLDPWLLGAALLFTPIALARRSTRAVTLAYLIQVMMIVRPGYLPAMYAIALLPFAALVVMGSIEALSRFATAAHPIRHPPAGQARWRVIGSRTVAMFMPMAVAASAVVVAASAVAAALYVAPRWASTDRAAMTVRLDDPERAAEHWLVQHVGHEQRLIVTDDFWIYLIEHGFDSHPVKGGFNSRTVISYWPLDKDPAVRRYFPYGWREFNYIVSTSAMRDTAKYTPSTAQALQHSRVVAAFGSGDQRIEIRAINPTPMTTGTGFANRMLQYKVPTSGAPTNLYQVAYMLGVGVNNIITSTNKYADYPAWWYYEAKHKYAAALPRGIKLHFSKT